jgi:hypothetical protein
MSPLQRRAEQLSWQRTGISVSLIDNLRTMQFSPDR